MREVFHPSSVAIVGASRDTKKWGGRVLRNLIAYGFDGDIWPVNPGANQVMGLPALHSVDDLPKGVDLAVIAVPSQAVAEVVDVLGRREARTALILASGFAELGELGQATQSSMVENARSRGMRLIGPNSLGVINSATGLVAAATSAVEVGTVPRGGLSVISQSGAVGLGTVLTRSLDRGRGVAKLISTGNESDLSSAELLNYLADDSDTDAIGLFMEGLGDGRLLLEGITKARLKNKPVALLKAGRTQQGAAAVGTHTGLLAGKGEVFRGAVYGAGGTWCDDLEDLLDKTSVPTRHIAPGSPPRMAIMSSSGGINTLGVDLLSDHGLEMASISPETETRLRELLPEFNPIANPLDVSGHVAGRAEIQIQCLRTLCSDPGVDGVIVILTFLPSYFEMAELLRREPPSGTLVAFVNTGGYVNTEACVALQRDVGCPVFASLTSCGAAIRDAWRSANWMPEYWSHEATDVTARLPTGSDDPALFEWLEAAEVPCVPYAVVASVDEAVSEAAALNYPVVVKAFSSDVMHKSDIGAVALNLDSPDDVRAAFKEIRQQVDSTGVKAGRFLIQHHVTDAIEVIIGGKVDEQFGPIVVVGHGGVLANLLNQAVIRIAPVSIQGAEEMLADLPGREIFDGYRGASRRDVIALTQIIARFSELVAAIGQGSLAFEFDLNPVLVMREGAGAVVADAVLQVKRGDQAAVARSLD